MQDIISVKGLCKLYRLSKADTQGRSELIAVNDVSFTVRAGEVFGVLGPNGAGKTTTLEILEGIKQQTSGAVQVLGLSNLTHAQQIKERIGVQLQSSSYLPALTLAELLRLFASIYKKKKDPLQLLRFVDLQDKAGEYVQNLSGGQKQRFTIATALVNDPEIIFLDEPTTGLDPRARRDLWNLVKNINAQGVTVALTTHYMEEAEFLCNRVAIMDHGKILKIDEPKRLIHDLAHTTQISFLTDAVLPADIWVSVQTDIKKVYSEPPKVIMEVKSLNVVGRVVELLAAHGVVFSGFTVKTASLEDVYLDLTGREYESVS